MQTRKDKYFKPFERKTQLIINRQTCSNSHQWVKKTFREALAIGVAKQYLPFTSICEKSIQDSYLAFHREFNTKKMQPVDKTVASDIKTMADKYVNEMKLRFTSRMSDVCLDFEDLLVKIKVQYLDREYLINCGTLPMQLIRN